MDNSRKLTFSTSDGVVFSLPLAGPLQRFLALVLDQLVITAASSAIGGVISMFAVLSVDIAFGLIIILRSVISTCYGIVLEYYWNGQTLGKKVFHIKVVDEQGQGLKLAQTAIRNVLRIVDMLPSLYLFGGICSFISRYNQRLGDIAANTVVIAIPQTNMPDFNQLIADKYNSFRTQAHLAARLRNLVSTQEAQVALEALIRRNEFDPSARIKVFGEIASRFKSYVQFPQELVSSLSDEQYVRNAVDILYRTE